MAGNLYRAINMADPSIFSPSDTLQVDTAVHTPVFISPDTTVYERSTVLYTVTGGVTKDSISWNFFNGMYTPYYGIGDSVVTVNFSPITSNPVKLSAYAQNGCGYNYAVINITVLPLKRSLAGTLGDGPDCSVDGIYPGVTSVNPDSTGSPISAITPSGANPVTGSIQSCVTVDASVQSYSGIPYVQRHYSLEPSTNPANSTATITLYFTQADFDTYNLARASNPALPTGPADATGISNLRITQFHGTGTDPGTYAGGSGDIDPDDNNIVWNASASRWEVTFNITGFSGFFASGGSLVPLPLTLLGFTGKSVSGGNLLQWTTSSEENTRSFEVQRNSSGNDYLSLATLPAAGNSHQELHYSYTDPLIGNNTATSNAYRLKMTDIDGKSTYSKTVVVQSPLTALAIRVTPNPFQQPLSLTVSSPEPAAAAVTVTDLSGKLLLQQNVSLQKGDNSLDPARIAALPKGMYLLSVTTDRQKHTVKLIRE